MSLGCGDLRDRRALWAIGRVVGMASLIVACQATGDSADDSFFGFEIGDCTTAPETQADYFNVEIVDCGESHALEVYAFVQSDHPEDAPFPGYTETGGHYNRLCSPLLAGYVGPSPSARYSVYAVYPGEEIWVEGAREGVCFVGIFNSQNELIPSTRSAKQVGG